MERDQIIAAFRDTALGETPIPSDRIAHIAKHSAALTALACLAHRLGELSLSDEIFGQERSLRFLLEGQKVKIIAGPFTGFTGVIESIGQRADVAQVQIDIFGRLIPASLDLALLEKIS